LIALSETEKAKELLLNFISSELSSHSSAFLGLSVILFAYLEVILRIYPYRINCGLCFTIPEFLRFLVMFGTFWTIMTLMVFTILRLHFLGRLSSRILRHSGEVWSSKQLLDKTVEEVKRVPILRWFSKGVLSSPKGLGCSWVIGLVISLVLFWAFLCK